MADRRDRTNWAVALCGCGCGERVRRYGAEYLRGHRPLRPLEERLWARVDRSGDGCWLWLGYRNSYGYGQIGVGRAGEGIVLTHRAAFQLAHGPIPDGLSVCHRCDNPPCCRPDHLFLGDHAENMQDCASKGRASGARGAANWNAKLSTAQVQEIRSLDQAGISRKAIATQYQITPQHVGAIARRQARKAA